MRRNEPVCHNVRKEIAADPAAQDHLPAEYADHLRQCSSCRGFLGYTTAISDLLAIDRDKTPPDESLWREISGRKATGAVDPDSEGDGTTPEETHSIFLNPFIRQLSAVAAVVVFIVSGWWFLSGPDRTSISETDPMPGEQGLYVVDTMDLNRNIGSGMNIIQDTLFTRGLTTF